MSFHWNIKHCFISETYWYLWSTSTEHLEMFIRNKDRANVILWHRDKDFMIPAKAVLTLMGWTFALCCDAVLALQNYLCFPWFLLLQLGIHWHDLKEVLVLRECSVKALFILDCDLKRTVMSGNGSGPLVTVVHVWLCFHLVMDIRKIGKN